MTDSEIERLEAHYLEAIADLKTQLKQAKEHYDNISDWAYCGFRHNNMNDTTIEYAQGDRLIGNAELFFKQL